MPKYAVHPFKLSDVVGHMSGKNLTLKKPALLFDKIIIPDRSYTIALTSIQHVNEWWAKKNMLSIFSEIDFLRSKGIVEIDTMETDEKVKDEMGRKFEREYSRAHDQTRKAYTKNEINGADIFDDMHEIMARMEATGLSKMRNADYVPLISNTVNTISATTKKQQILNFLLDKIPQPLDTMSWEEIIDIRNDEAMKVKYYALINWVNEVAKSQLPLNEVEDKYNYLYHDYLQQYKLHQKAFQLSTLEIITAGIGDFFTSGAVSGLQTLKSLFQIRKQNLILLESEGKIPGKEIAYIYRVENRLK